MFEIIGMLWTAVAGTIAAWWAFEKWRKRDEHFPRIELEVSANFVGAQSGRMLTEVVAVVENKGVVPLKYKSFTFKIIGVRSSEPLIRGDRAIRGQVKFPHAIAEGSFIPDHWEYSFVYPDVRTEYNYVIDIPSELSFIRVQADMNYMLRGESHHAARVLRVPTEEGIVSSAP